jgi:Zn-dependent peptidase ImmA (M78 family)
MAQIIVRGIDDGVMAMFRAEAKRQGKSAEQLARELIEREAELDAAWERFNKRADEIRERLAKKYGVVSDSSELIREDRDSR